MFVCDGRGAQAMAMDQRARDCYFGFSFHAGLLFGYPRRSLPRSSRDGACALRIPAALKLLVADCKVSQSR